MCSLFSSVPFTYSYVKSFFYFTIYSFVKGKGGCGAEGIDGRTEKEGPDGTRKPTLQASQFRLGPAPSWALKNGLYICTCPPEIQIPTCTKRLSSKRAQVRKQILLEPPLIAVPLSRHHPCRGRSHLFCPPQHSQHSR